MLDEICARNSRWESYRQPIADAWSAYIDGTRSLAEAAADLVRALPEQPSKAAR